jgi:peroxiredoxin
VAQLRDAYPDIVAKGVDVVAIGTGDVRYAKAFVVEESIPFTVLVDDDGEAATAASIRRSGAMALVAPRTWANSRQAWRNGFRIHRSGQRVMQLGATFAVGPGSRVAYAHVDVHSSDHAPLDEVLAGL